MKNNGIKISIPDAYSFDAEVNGQQLGYGLLSEKELEVRNHRIG